MRKLKEAIHVCEICGKPVKAPEFLFENSKISEVCTLINDSGMEHIKIRRQQVYNQIPQDKKQAFLDQLWKGKTVGESYEAAGLTQEEGFAVMDLNIEKTHYLRTDAK